MDFVGRHRELKELKAAIEHPQPQISVIYGRRRIGKSALIKRALHGRSGSLFFEGLENQPKHAQIQNFLSKLTEYEPEIEIKAPIKEWRDALKLLVPILRKKPGCIVLDEFQWMANNRHQLVSDLKMIWDQYLSQIKGTSLILCGSIASFMIAKVVKSKALYGRTQLVIRLKPFGIDDSLALMGKHGFDEVLLAQMLVGGIPLYLNLLKEAPSVHISLENLAFRENGFFVLEYERIFISHFGKQPDYQRIVGLLAKYPYGIFRTEIADQLGLSSGGTLSDHLDNLESAGFIDSIVPVDKAQESRLIKYRLADPYLRFYFAFIAPNLKRIRQGLGQKYYMDVIRSRKFESWMGLAFEQVCSLHGTKIAELLGFGAVQYDVGPFFRSKHGDVSGIQIDLMYSRADHVLTVCEMKNQLAPVGPKVIKEVETKVNFLREFFPRKTIQPVLIVNGEVSQSLMDQRYFYRIIKAKELV